MDKAILLINAKGNIGGAENRYINLFNRICSFKNDYYLIINHSLFDVYNAQNFFLNKRHIIILELKNIAKKPFGIYRSEKTKKKTLLRKLALITINKVKLIITWIDFLIKMRRIIKHEKIRYIYAIWQGGIWGWVLKKIFDIKFVYSYMDASLASLSRNPMNFLEKEYWVLKNADIIDCLSPKIASDLQDKNFFPSKQKISVTPNSFIDYSRYYPSDEKENLIVFLSRLNPSKNPLLFLESVVLIHELLKELNYTVLIAGKGSETISIQDFIESHQLIRVEYIGEIFGSNQLLSRSKIFISIQRDNNYPSQSLMEAMACANAIIASDVGETRKLVTENEGVLVLLDPVEISEAIVKLIKNEDELKKLGCNARAKVTKEHTFEKYLEYFYSLERI